MSSRQNDDTTTRSSRRLGVAFYPLPRLLPTTKEKIPLEQIEKVGVVLYIIQLITILVVREPVCSIEYAFTVVSVDIVRRKRNSFGRRCAGHIPDRDGSVIRL